MDCVLYLRASTLRQSQSGLGLEGQCLIAHRFLQAGDQIEAEYIEVESGRKNNRPEMAQAIAETHRLGATLLVAEMSRLTRSVYFTSKLLEERVRFKACDIPNADEFTINILAAVAQKGAKDISDATKRDLAAKKARGFTLGNPENFTNDSRAQGRAMVQQNAREAVPIAAQQPGLAAAPRWALLEGDCPRAERAWLSHSPRQALSQNQCIALGQFAIAGHSCCGLGRQRARSIATAKKRSGGQA